MRKFLPFSSGILLLLLIITGNKAFSQKDYRQQGLDLIRKNLSQAGLSSDDADNLTISDAYFNSISQTMMVYAQQTYKGIGVYNGIQIFAFKEEKLVSQAGQRISKMANRVSVADGTPVISSADAVRAVATHLNKTIGEAVTPIEVKDDGKKIVYSSMGIAQDNITTQLLWVPAAEGKVVLSWQVQIAPVGSSDHWLIRIDAVTAAVLGKDNFTVSCRWDKPHNHNDDCVSVEHFTGNNTVADCVETVKSVNAINTATYRVSPYPAESPQHPGGTLALVTDPWNLASAGNNATTLKWNSDGTTDYNITRGNNVWAQEDRDNNNATMGAPATSSTALPSLTFDFPYNAASNPTAYVSQPAALTNLFYWNNIMHDVTYQYGFDEVSGNFQANNLGRGGLGNDYVIADGQDSASINNANFSTPADGSRPRMQMFLWSSVPASAMYINSPAGMTGNIYAVESYLTASNNSPNNLLAKLGPKSGNLVLYNDADNPDLHYACVAPINAASIAGKIAVIDRGSTCSFSVKVKNAQLAGAIGVIVVNNVAGTPITMGGTFDASITIPALMISQTDGATIKTALISGQTINITLTPMDGDMDNGVMAHEYTHGISNRLTGGPASASCLQNAEQMGEGWSDYYALMVTTNWATATVSDGPNKRAIGTYVTGQSPVTGGGIRNYPYSTNMSVNPWTYAMLATNTGGESHNIGEIWCTVLWDMTWAIIQMDGINANFYNANGVGGNSIAMKLVTMGMKLQPCSPGFIDGRDGILKADTLLFNGRYSCAIWSAFARRGMGAFASQGSSNSYTDQTADYTIPASATVKKSANKAMAAMNEEITYSFTVTAQCSDVSNFSIIDTLPANVTYVTGSGGTYNATSRTVTFSNIAVLASQKQVFSFRAKVNMGSYAAPVQHVNETVSSTTIASAWTSASSVTTKWTVSSAQSHSAPYSFFASEPTTPADMTLTTTNAYNLTNVSTLSFWHFYSTESGYDGGVVEMSTNNGATWIDLYPYMIQNPCNAVIAPDAGTGITNRRAFTGSSNGFIQTVVNLSTFAGSSAKFRFRFVTDNGTAVLGWYVDDIVLKSEAGVYNKATLYNSANVLQGTSDTITLITNAVPVQWGSFTAEKDGMKALLKWSTLHEENSESFSIERSTDGINYTQIGTVHAAGYSNQQTNYQFVDVAPAYGINHYRLKQIDKDGRSSYSEVRSLTFSAVKGAIVIYPNPAKDKIEITVPGNTKTLQVQLLNSLGQQLHTYTMQGQYLPIQLGTMLPGMYYLKITGEEGEQVRKLMIQ